MNRDAQKVAVKHTQIDLLIIVISAALSMIIYSVFYHQIVQFIGDDTVPILLRLLSVASFQFGTAGLGITIVSILRKEPFTKFGLNLKNIIPAIFFSCLMYIPNVILNISYHNWKGYFPFQSVWTTQELMSSSLPVAVIGMLITAVIWGFFEGFNYAVIMDKINLCLPSKYWWLDWGAIICAVMCILIHGAVGVTPKDLLEMLSILIIIYGSLMVRKKTGNSWGLVFTFLFLWNAY